MYVGILLRFLCYFQPETISKPGTSKEATANPGNDDIIFRTLLAHETKTRREKIPGNFVVTCINVTKIRYKSSMTRKRYSSYRFFFLKSKLLTDN